MKRNISYLVPEDQSKDAEEHENHQEDEESPAVHGEIPLGLERKYRQGQRHSLKTNKVMIEQSSRLCK